MNIEELLNENIKMSQEISKLKLELNETKEHLKKYTAPLYKKTYYENNKEIIKERRKQYKKPTEEQKKKWARKAYLKKKEFSNKDISENI